MIERDLGKVLKKAAADFPVVTLTGPRQSGKTTLCRYIFPDRAYVSLESPDTRHYASRDPRGFLAEYPDGAIFDEVQRVPDLLSYLQGIVDTDPRPGRFILTGSQHFALLQSVSQSLAGRTRLLNLLPLSFAELSTGETVASPPTTTQPPGTSDTGSTDIWSVIFKGGYPAIHDRHIPPRDWLSSYVGSYIERDVRQLTQVDDLQRFQTLLSLAAGHSSQLINYSRIAGDVGISHNTAKKWLGILETSFIAFRLRPWLSNPNKRVVKTPKLVFFDSGLLCYLLDVRNARELVRHPLRGAIFETWVVSEIYKTLINAGQPANLHFYRDRSGTEVDLIVPRGERTFAVEVKSANTIVSDFFRSLRTFAGRQNETLGLEKIVVYGGDEIQRRTAATIVPWQQLDAIDWAG